MAANKFATMLSRNTNKLTLILIYAVLEWTLIILLFLNSLFSYLIIKFADYFGLKQPCFWCSRLDHIFEPGKKKNMHRDLLCEVHAKEISKLGYCSNHQKLAQSQDMCEDCSSSQPDFVGPIPKNLTLFPWMKQVGLIQGEGDNKIFENGELSLNCSCCGVSMDDKELSPYIVIKPSWDELHYPRKESLIHNDDDYIQEGDTSDHSRSDIGIERCGEEDEKGTENKTENQMLSDVVDGGFDVREVMEAGNDCSALVSEAEMKVVQNDDEDDDQQEAIEIVMKKDASTQVCSAEDTSSIEIQPQHLEFFIDFSGHRLVPIELVDSPTDEDQSRYIEKDEEQAKNDNQETNLDSESHVERKIESILEDKKEPNFSVLEFMELEEDDNSLVFHAKECHSVIEVLEQLPITQTESKNVDDDVQGMVAEHGEERNIDASAVSEEVPQVPTNETEADVSIGTEIPDLDLTDDIPNQEPLSFHGPAKEDPSTSASNLHDNSDDGIDKTQKEMVEFRSLVTDLTETAIKSQLTWNSEINENEEEKVPDTPTSVDSLHNLHKKLLLLDKKDSGTEESLDGSVISEFEGSEGVMTVERLRSALRTERKALQALYAELEEERSASAVAANQTMAMINRLQEEKAAVQMEALQYQRMMEEQSEYDQEALQLLNELMVKREKEKQELEKELEIYRKKVLDYESKGKIKVLRKSKDGSTRSGFSSASCSNGEDSDGLSIDLNQEAKDDDGVDSCQESGNHNTPVDAVLNLEESLVSFEEERMSILEQLKVLEQQLFTLDDEEGQYFEDSRPIGHFHELNGNHQNENSDFDGELDGVANGYSKEANGQHHHERRIIRSKGKKLLPLFDAISAENEDGVLNGHVNGFDSDGLHDSPIAKSESEKANIALEDEVDHLYERLQALEADREFLKHCISSLKKGDKGMDLLQEILQHLRDLRNVELRARNVGDCSLV